MQQAAGRTPPSTTTHHSSGPLPQVYGKVQGVYFRQHTMEEGRRLALRGWVANTVRGTVVGEVEGPVERLAEFKARAPGPPPCPAWGRGQGPGPPPPPPPLPRPCQRAGCSSCAGSLSSPRCRMAGMGRTGRGWAGAAGMLPPTAQPLLPAQPDHAAALQDWLQHKGSPDSRIERAEFREERDIAQLTHASFERKPGKLP